MRDHRPLRDEQQCPGMLLPTALKDELAAILAECLIAELREEHIACVQDVEKPTVNSPGGTDRGTRNLAEDKDLAPERDRAL